MKSKLFCPKCHQSIELPAFIKTANIQGEVRLKCGRCKNGTAVIPAKRAAKTQETANG